jgi:hypothetical protein
MAYNGDGDWFAGKEESIVNESGSDASFRVDQPTMSRSQ